MRFPAHFLLVFFPNLFFSYSPSRYFFSGFSVAPLNSFPSAPLWFFFTPDSFAPHTPPYPLGKDFYQVAPKRLERPLRSPYAYPHEVPLVEASSPDARHPHKTGPSLFFFFDANSPRSVLTNVRRVSPYRYFSSSYFPLQTPHCFPLGITFFLSAAKVPPLEVRQCFRYLIPLLLFLFLSTYLPRHLAASVRSLSPRLFATLNPFVRIVLVSRTFLLSNPPYSKFLPPSVSEQESPPYRPF